MLGANDFAPARSESQPDHAIQLDRCRRHLCQRLHKYSSALVPCLQFGVEQHSASEAPEAAREPEHLPIDYA